MARIVESSDDDLPDLDALLKGNVAPNAATAASALKENEASRANSASRNLSGTESGSKKEENIFEGKKKTKKRVLNQRSDNPLLKPLSSTRRSNVKSKTSLAKRKTSPKETIAEEEGEIVKTGNNIEILYSEEDGDELRVESSRNSQELVGNVDRDRKLKTSAKPSTRAVKGIAVSGLGCEGKDVMAQSSSISEKPRTTVERDRKLNANPKFSSKQLRSQEASEPESDGLLSKEPMVLPTQVAEKPLGNVLGEKKRRTNARSSSKKVRDEESSELECGGLSDFIVGDSTFLDEEESIIAMPPPRSVRRLVKGRRPTRLDDSEDELVLDKGDITDTRKTSKTLRLGKGLDPCRISDSECLPKPSIAVKKPRRFTSKAAQGSDSTLLLELENLSLRDSFVSESLPTRVPREQRFSTPPGSPVLKPIKLKSPTKTFLPIPKSPHRPSMDSFWNSEVINDWNDEYSPQKTLKTFRLDENEPKGGILLFSPKKSPVKQDRIARDVKKAFSDKKHDLAESFLIELDEVLTQSQISKLSASTGGIKIIWSKKLNTTAGRANWKRETVKSNNTQGIGEVTYRHHASIELAEKVIDDESRLLNVIAHEFCHLANFMISNIKTNPHGKEFKAWAVKCSRHFGHRGIEVTTKHSYEIDYKYVWECESCGLEFKRHSKSIDPVKHQCGSCKSKLVQTKPVPRGDVGGVKKVSEYQVFVKENMSRVREENPGSPQKEILGFVAKSYQEYKAAKLKPVDTDGPKVGEETRRKEKTPEVEDNVKSLVRKLDFLDLTSP